MIPTVTSTKRRRKVTALLEPVARQRMRQRQKPAVQTKCIIANVRLTTGQYREIIILNLAYKT